MKSVNFGRKNTILRYPWKKISLKTSLIQISYAFKFRVIQHLVEVQNEKLKTARDGDVDALLDEISELKQTEMEIAKIIGNVTVK